MARSAADWTTYQLTEFMDGISRADDERSAIRLAVERAAEALDAEVAAIVVRTTVRACVGFQHDAVPDRELIALAEGRQKQLEVPGVGPCTAAKVVLQSQPPGVLLAARHSDEPFGPSEHALLAGMARVLALTERLLRVAEGERTLREKVERQAEDNAALLASLQERQLLLERLTVVQRSISRQAPLPDVLAAITEGTSRLLADDIVALRLIDPEDPGYLVMASAAGINPELLETAARLPVEDGVSGEAVASRGLVVVDDYASDPNALARFVDDEVNAMMAAPICDRGEVIGVLVVASRKPGRVYGSAEQEALTVFAEHAGLALADATELRAELVGRAS